MVPNVAPGHQADGGDETVHILETPDMTLKGHPNLGDNLMVLIVNLGSG